MAGKNLEDYKYDRLGYIFQNKWADHLLLTFLAELPGDGTLPPFWRHEGHVYFTGTYGHLGITLWARSQNSHLLFVNGFHILRIWTDKKNSCFVDINDSLASVISNEMIPLGNSRKAKPFTKRVRVWEKEQMQKLANKVKEIYGLDS